ncbi:lysophospholipid acyltransferase family protein [bacterium]|nr:lysophospholipid acyltransferase family protein [bacterium]
MKTLIDLLTLTFLNCCYLAVRILPAKLGKQICMTLTALGISAVPKFKAVALRNLEHVFPELTQTARVKIFRQSIAGLGLNFYYFLTLENYSLEWAKQHFEYAEAHKVFDTALKQAEGKGIIIATVHYGCFELLVHVHALLSRPTSILARGLDLKYTDRWINRRRNLTKNTVFERKGAYQKIVSNLQSGCDVAMLIDQNVKINHAVFINFFGHTASATKSVALAAERTSAPIIFAAIRSLGDDRFYIHAELMQAKLQGKSVTEKVHDLTQELHSRIEVLVKNYPEEWFWIHRRWKTQPPGKNEDFYSTNPS